MSRLPRFLKRARQGHELMPLSKHMPSGCAIRRTNGADVAHVASLLRPADPAEMEAPEGQPAVDILTAAVDAPGLGQARTLTIHR